MRYGIVTDVTGLTVQEIQSADAADLQNRINTLLDAQELGTVLMSLNLAGGGDGHTFVAQLEFATQEQLPDGGLGTVGFIEGQSLSATQVRCFLAGTAEELAVARTAAGVPDPLVIGQTTIGWSQVDTQVAGSSKGTRFMGLRVFYSAIVSQPIAQPFAFAVTTQEQAIGNGAVTMMVAFDVLTQYQFNLETAADLRYTGPVGIRAQLDVSITVQLDAPADVLVEIVRDPANAPSIVASQSSSVDVADGHENISVLGVFDLIPFAIGGVSFADLGVRITTTGPGVITGCQFRVWPMGSI